LNSALVSKPVGDNQIVLGVLKMLELLTQADIKQHMSCYLFSKILLIILSKVSQSILVFICQFSLHHLLENQLNFIDTS